MREGMRERQMELTARRNEFKRVKRRLDGAEAQLEEAKRERDRLKRQLTKEQQDVVKLGSFSFMNKLKEWSGKWDAQMEREIQEAAEAELAYNEAEKMVADVEVETAELRKQAARPELSFIEDDWADFLLEKEAWIRMNDSDSDRTLRKIADDRVHIRSMLREIDEAIEAGRLAVKALDLALDKLGNAEGLSMWDTFLGGGLLVSALKYSEMNSSDDLVHQAQRALRLYKTELMDVQNVASESFQVNRNDFFTFTDIVFDNFFSDLVVHSRITEAMQQLTAVLKDVHGVQAQLARKKDEGQEELKRLDEEERRILES